MKLTMQTPSGIEDHRQLPDWSKALPNITDYNVTDLPIDMRFNDGHKLSIIVYSILMVISAIGNITVLVLILRRRRSTPTRINTMLMHLAIADLLVTFLMMPLEIGWSITVSWKAGDAMCRIMAFFRTFGLYLSSFVLVCISVDRYYAVLKPLHLIGLDRRGKLMITFAWAFAALCSMPQMVIFHVERHPNITWYEQCITYNSFPSTTHELTYSLLGMVLMYGLPLVVIVFSYASILLEIFRRLKDNNSDCIRRSSLGFLGRAKIRTLKMTIIIVLVFFICWTPYYVMCLWYWIDRDSAMQVDQRIQKCLFLFACTNSCMNPIVYGAFNIRARRGADGPQSQDLAISRARNSTARRHYTNDRFGTVVNGQHGHDDRHMDVVCKVSWKKPTHQDEKSIVTVTTTPTNKMHRRDVCLSCGESFELRVAVTSSVTASNGDVSAATRHVDDAKQSAGVGLCCISGVNIPPHQRHRTSSYNSEDCNTDITMFGITQ